MTYLKEHNEHCKRIADELEKIVDGEFYTTSDGDEIDATRIDSSVLDEYLERMEANPYTLWDYFVDVYNIDYTVTMINGELTYKGVNLMVACGGPNIYINTNSGNVELYWWTEAGSWSLTNAVIREIDYIFEEYFEMNLGR